ncbi:MAG: glycosyltransferase family 9 protein [Desulfovibrionaceae bacterium]
MAQFLVIQLARFGDIVQTKRLMATLRMRGTVHLCVDTSLMALARLVYPYAHVHALCAHGAPHTDAFIHNVAVFARLRALTFDQVYNINHSGLNRAVARLFDPALVHGYAMYADQPVHAPWVRMAFRWAEERRRTPLNLVDFWAHFTMHPLAPLRVNPPAAGQGRGLGVVLAGREQRRSLPIPVLAQVVHTAFESMGGVPVYLLGSAAEKSVARQLIRALPGVMLDKVHSLVGQTDWSGLAAALIGLDAVLSPDTGTMHLAAHLGVPVRAFFLSSAWCFETGPYGEGHQVWQACAECAPCLESAACPVQVACGAVFQSPAFVRSLAAHVHPQGSRALWLRGAQPPIPGLMTLSSTVDTVGTYWQGDMSQDVFADERQQLRDVVTEYLEPDPPLPLTVGVRGAVSATLMDTLYDESQWMLTPRDSIFAG